MGWTLPVQVRTVQQLVEAVEKMAALYQTSLCQSLNQVPHRDQHNRVLSCVLVARWHCSDLEICRNASSSQEENTLLCWYLLRYHSPGTLFQDSIRGLLILGILDDLEGRSSLSFSSASTFIIQKPFAKYYSGLFKHPPLRKQIMPLFWRPLKPLKRHLGRKKY